MAKKKTSTTQIDDRTRNWTIIIYSDSIPENWNIAFSSITPRWIKSPAHNSDIDETTGNIKKSHCHVIFKFKTNKSQKQVSELLHTHDLEIVGKPEKVQSMKGLVRYMIHLDNPDKSQYSIDEIIAHNIAISEYLDIDCTDSDYESVGEIIDYINQNNITEYKDLVNYAHENEFDDWFPIVCKKAYMLNAFIASNRNSSSKIQTQVIKINFETGEVVP